MNVIRVKYVKICVVFGMQGCEKIQKNRVSPCYEGKKLVTRKNSHGVGNHYEEDSKVSLNYEIKNSKDL